MIEELHIRGLGVIEDVSLRLAPGLTVVTGETGAGKTLIVTALGLLLGGRGSGDLVRAGEAAALIEALVAVPDGADGGPSDDRPADAEADGGDDRDGADATGPGWDEAEDGVLTLVREVPRDGRSRVRIGGRLATVGALRDLLGSHVEVHGQDEHRRIERPALQRHLLDRMGDAEHAVALAAYASAHGRWNAARRRRELAGTDARERTRRIAVLRAERDEIAALGIDPERDGRIDAELDRLMHADELRGALAQAAAEAGADGAGEALGRAAAALRRLPARDDELTALADRAAGLVREASELAADLASLAGDVEADPARLDELQLRKRDLTALMRRFGATPADVLAHHDAVVRELADLEALEVDEVTLRAEEEAALADVRTAGGTVTRGREAAAARLAAQVAGHLADLGLGHAALHVEVRPAGGDPGPSGLDDVAFLLAANPGERPVRIGDGASGGERSRVALALEVALAEVDEASVLVFDEVDAGVGGTTALAVGEKLAHLAAGARRRQVLCVTHLAQVAAFADVHHVVEKVVRDGRTVTVVREVAEGERVAELSRMLGGEATADKGLEHAAGLLAAARGRAGAVGTAGAAATAG
ncbi:MAG: DNA repair protein RecN [Nitriliruptoraceae bacterium]